MMSQAPRFRVFLGAPSRESLRRAPLPYLSDAQPRPYFHWMTVSSKPDAPPPTAAASSSQSMVLPPATLAAVSRRLSSIYQNVIFDDDELQEAEDLDDSLQDLNSGISWPPTAHQDESEMPSFLNNIGARRSGIYNTSKKSLHELQQGTQDTAFDSYNISDTSSVARFPAFSFSMNSIKPLSSILSSAYPLQKVNVLGAIIEIEGPETITVKNGPDKGKQVSLLKIILGDDKGAICKLTAWRDVAEAWGGGVPDMPGAKRGDVVFLQNVMTAAASSSPMLTASPFNKSKLEICYRTLPYAHEDMRLRPDLRLAHSDATVRRVSTLVQWFEKLAGLTAKDQ